jgi:pimeloyl-ACP methyl ester carboxylesterase
MDPPPRLIDVATRTDPTGVVLVLHGGANRRGSPMVSPTQLSVLRMVPIARRIARAGRGRLAVLRLLNSSRGWDTRHTPVDDVAWALDELERHADTLPPVALVGHSLGGRAALLAAADPRVVAAVARALSARANVEFVVVPGGKHAMLRHHGAFSGPAARFVAERLR